ncbi:hypothetical protein PT974_12038 [Cladobotryum mycophilum]|uniref:DEAD/DEAH-box helicase domain-containing protein n=1 Tax=Cladobotryum mycophilum TaxID=491253 RepID=A0ABR0S7T9_9HYPO
MHIAWAIRRIPTGQATLAYWVGQRAIRWLIERKLLIICNLDHMQSRYPIKEKAKLVLPIAVEFKLYTDDAEVGASKRTAISPKAKRSEPTIEERLGVLVVPLRALSDDIEARLRGYGMLSVKKWSKEHTDHSSALVVLVQPESLGQDEWKRYTNELRATKAVDLVMVDEAHMVLDGTNDFRPALRTIGSQTDGLAPRDYG